MDIKTWDQTVAPYLREIEDYSVSLALRCGWINTALGNLPARPSWPSKAEGALVEAEELMAAALAKVRAARVIYAAKPVIEDEA